MKLFWIISGSLLLLLSFFLIWTIEVEEQTQQTAAIKDNPALSFQKIVLIDTFKNQLQKEEVEHHATTEYYPIFLGQWKDTILLNYNIITTTQTEHDIEKFEHAVPTDILVWVDTTKIIGSGHYNIIPPPLSAKMLDTTNWFFRDFRVPVASYPVFIYNHSKKSVPISKSHYLPLNLEAQDSLSNWKPIQDYYRPFCGTGLTYTYLKPNDVLLTSCPIHEGNYETNLRIAFAYWYSNEPIDSLALYSNTFRGTINYSQFEQE